MKRLLLTGGGTGGHIYPAVAVGLAFVAEDPTNEILFLGGKRGLESRIVPAADIPFKALPARGFFGKRGLLDRIAFVGDLMAATLMAMEAMRKFRPEAVLATGGYASLPALTAARIMRIPIFLLEQNSVPGRAIRLFAPAARAVFLAWQGTGQLISDKPHKVVTGNPLRREMIDLARRRRGGTQVRERRGAGRLLIFGGSQGAAVLNRAAREALPLLAREFDFEAVVQTGEVEESITREALADLGSAVTVQAYLKNMPEVMAVSDWVISRSGAMTLAEITAMGLPALLVPFPHAIDDHQTRNAKVLEDAGAALLIRESEFDGRRLAEELAELWRTPGSGERMAAECARLGQLDATERILAEMEKSLAGVGGR
ncbi:MAG: undecaprenyldiphospho-muramoylpentapeptide beta-N-acetylglucosaminyltransferase [bacterium]|nr:undecaprenyldiphospho-muramoylpentapeptide beta-N-acetylglucosaminyltransferase [bacterium]